MTEQQQATQPLEESTVPRRSSRVAARVVEGVALVVVLDQREVHRLDEVGSRIWQLCDGRSVGDICDVLVDEFEVERDRALGDLQRFLRALADKGALSLGESPA